MYIENGGYNKNNKWSFTDECFSICCYHAEQRVTLRGNCTSARQSIATSPQVLHTHAAHLPLYLITFMQLWLCGRVYVCVCA